MSREIEDRLKAAVQAKMRTVTVDRLRPPQLPTDDDVARLVPRRHSLGRWTAPLLAAAAVAAVALGTTAAVTLADGHHPATTPSPAPTSVVTPGPSSAPTTAPTGPPASSSTSQAPPTGSTSNPVTPGAPSGHAVDVSFNQATVGVTVPSGWVLSHTNPPACCDTPPTRCFVHRGADFSGDANDCLLTVTVGHLRPDLPYPYQGQSACQHWQTTAESNGPIQGRLAEYRQFKDPCSGAVYDQWTIMSSPMIAFWHPVSAQSSTALIEQVIDSARLPAEVDARRQLDEGYLQGLTKHADGYHVTIDRVVVNLDGSVTNVNHATYEYRLAGSLVTNGDSPCSGCQGVDEVYQQYRKGPHPSDGSKPVDGAFVTLTSNFAANVDGGYELDLSPIRPFQP
jgi:hypothetical protein